MKTTFDTNRFMNLLKYEIFTESKGFARGAIGLTVGLAFSFMANLYFERGLLMETPLAFNNFYGNLAGVALFVGFALMMVAGCSIFKNLLSKQNRITFLSLPASNLEKYISRFIWVNVGYAIMFVIAVIFADLILALFSLMLGLGVHGSLTVTLFAELFESKTTVLYSRILNPGYFSVMVCTIMLFMQSSWTLLGTLFRKNAWLWTLCIQVFLGTSWAMAISGSDSFLSQLWLSFHSTLGHDLFFWIHVIFGLAASALMYWGSYRIFCRMQVINNKWLNV